MTTSAATSPADETWSTWRQWSSKLYPVGSRTVPQGRYNARACERCSFWQTRWKDGLQKTSPVPLQWCRQTHAGTIIIPSTLALVLTSSVIQWDNVVGYRLNDQSSASGLADTYFNKCRLSHCLQCISSFNTHLSNFRPWFSMHCLFLEIR